MDMKQDVKTMESKYILNTYRRDPAVNILIERGEGCWVWDEKGQKYLDFVSGLGVNSLGHSHPAVVQAVQDQVSKLIHTSNLYYTAPQAELAALLVENSFAHRVFMANSGAEANEAAIKLARKFYSRQKGEERYKIVSAKRSFHGRTMATVAATGQEKFQDGFQPLIPGFSYATFNDINSFAELVDAETCAVIVEPVQGEAGVYPADPAFLRELRELCNQQDVLLIFDEVQCGMGRTGELWSYQDYGVEPDVLTAAKALGGGLPIGVMMTRQEPSSGLGPGDHAATFGGNPLVCRAAVAVLETMLEEGFLKKVRQKAEQLKEYLHQLQWENPGQIKEIRGRGLMLAIELGEEVSASSLRQQCQEKGLLVNAIGEKIIRLLPPLIMEDKEMEHFGEVFRDCLI